MVEKQKEVDNLQGRPSRPALETLREPRRDKEHEKVKESFRLLDLETCLRRLAIRAIQQHVQLQKELDTYEEAATEATKSDSIEKYLMANGSDIYENDEAFEAFLGAWKGGFEIDPSN